MTSADDASGPTGFLAPREYVPRGTKISQVRILQTVIKFFFKAGLLLKKELYLPFFHRRF